MPNEAIITINRKFSRPPAEMMKPFRNIPTGYVVDVQDRRGAIDCSIKPMFDFPSIAGPAVTVQTVPDDNLAPYLAMDVLRAGDVLVIANGGWTGSSVVGDLIAGMFKNIGVAAIVTDGAVRDVAGLKKRRLPLALTPEGTTTPVAEITIFLMLAVLRRLTFADSELRQGRWHINSLRHAGR